MLRVASHLRYCSLELVHKLVEPPRQLSQFADGIGFQPLGEVALSLSNVLDSFHNRIQGFCYTAHHGQSVKDKQHNAAEHHDIDNSLSQVGPEARCCRGLVE